MKDYELLAPAGGEQSAYVAFDSGADAVYLGMSQFSARASAENFDVEALRRVTRYAHLLGKKVFVALNTLVKDEEVSAFCESVGLAYECGADAILVQDIFLGKRLKDAYPELTLHLSTQAGCCNEYGARLAKAFGFSRVVLARETPLSEIEKIASIIETEVFIQGALCTCFSGQCYFSSFVGNNSGNRGRCKQPCRKQYSINRKGFELPAYAISLADLSVGEQITALQGAGVYSFKIEGRLRREEYVASAVKYYKNILSGEKGDLSALKRAFNRGDYTKGLAFGQDERFVSNKVQGHIGERVGYISARKRNFCESTFTPKKGDGFKVLRKGYEVGGGTFLSAEKGGFTIATSARLEAGDEVRITTDTASAERILSGKCPKKISLSLRFMAGEVAEVSSGDFTYYGETPLERAEKSPLTAEDLAKNFEKVDTLPLSVEIETVQTNGVFMAKSQLNAFRRAFYEAYANFVDPAREPLEKGYFSEVDLDMGANMQTATITEDGKNVSGVAIYKPKDYGKMTVPKGAYLYLPPLFTTDDEKYLLPVLDKVEGFYGEGYYVIPLADKYHKKWIAGTGFNVTNRFAVDEIRRLGATYIVLSKELTFSEQSCLDGEDTFALSVGELKLMDLCYCPFGKKCSECDKKDVYEMTDEDGRVFFLRRYRLGGDCRFEVFNNVPVKTTSPTGKLYDNSLSRFPELGKGKEELPVRNVTSGHQDRSLI